MKKLIDLLLNQSLKDLFKHKSFFLLIFVLILVDRFIKYFTDSKKSQIDLPKFETLSAQVAEYVFVELPGVVFSWLTDYRTLLVLVTLFLLKQLISMWPSSDMRRMHRDERERFGIFASLIAIHGKQVVWDAIAVGTVVAVSSAWLLVCYLATYLVWNLSHSIGALFLFALLSSLIGPIAMAGFSYSSKLAVISLGDFKEKLALFFQLFTNKRVFAISWAFFTLRIVIEAIFVVILPLTILWVMENAIARITIAGLIATPFYSFLKMASFKFFLFTYKPFPLVQTEYKAYYQTD